MTNWKPIFRNLKQAWKRPSGKLIVVAILAPVLMVIVPFKASAQFGLDPCCAIISAGLNTISGLLKSAVAKPLSSIQQIQQQTADFEQQVVYPISAINNARTLAGQMQGQLRQISQLYRLPIASATLYSYPGVGGTAVQVKVCAADFLLQSATALLRRTAR